MPCVHCQVLWDKIEELNREACRQETRIREMRLEFQREACAQETRIHDLHVQLGAAAERASQAEWSLRCVYSATRPAGSQ